MLFHGTLLLKFDLQLIGELLRMPSLQPDYRQGRSHEAFVTNVNLPSENVKDALRTNWGVSGRLSISLGSEIAKLVEHKYSKPEWNLKL